MDDSEPGRVYPDGAPVSMSEASGVARSAGVVGAATLTSRFLGLARDMVLANLFAPWTPVQATSPTA